MSISEEVDTETKLAILQSLFDNVSQSTLLEQLLEHDGSVEQVIETWSSKRPRLDELAASRTSPFSSEVCLKSRPYHQLKWNPSASVSRRKVEPLLELFTADQIETAAPCTLIKNVLPTPLAIDLLRSMLEESKDWTQGYFKLFDRTVTSPHVAGFYLRSPADVDVHRRYVYNGQPIANIHCFNKEMAIAHALVEKATRDWLSTQEGNDEGVKHDTWHANVAFANLYDGRDSAVGYHSDQLTYLGPLPTIASLSLGCEREFRLRPVSSNGNGRTLSIRLPHNSLLIMGPGCQEDYKHSVHPVPDKKGLDLHPIAGTKRINITYRQYRKEYAPEVLPHCDCGQAVLRSAKSDPSTNSRHEGPAWKGRRYFWHCDGDKKPNCDGCKYFQWAKFTKEGAPVL